MNGEDIKISLCKIADSANKYLRDWIIGKGNVFGGDIFMDGKTFEELRLKGEFITTLVKLSDGTYEKRMIRGLRYNANTFAYRKVHIIDRNGGLFEPASMDGVMDMIRFTELYDLHVKGNNNNELKKEEKK